MGKFGTTFCWFSTSYRGVWEKLGKFWEKVERFFNLESTSNKKKGTKRNKKEFLGTININPKKNVFSWFLMIIQKFYYLQQVIFRREFAYCTILQKAVEREWLTLLPLLFSKSILLLSINLLTFFKLFYKITLMNRYFYYIY